MVLKYDIFKFAWAVFTEKRIFKCLRPNYKRKIGFRPQLCLKSKTSTNEQLIGCLVY